MEIAKLLNTIILSFLPLLDDSDIFRGSFIKVQVSIVKKETYFVFIESHYLMISVAFHFNLDAVLPSLTICLDWIAL